MTAIAVLVLGNPATAEIAVGYNQPFYLDTDLEGGDIGGHGYHLEYSWERWYVSLDHLENVKRRDDGYVDNQHFINAGYRYPLPAGFEVSGGLSVNEVSDVLGSALSFNLGIGYRRGPYSITWRHWSNANTNDVNHGFDAITLTYRIR
jgi:hypothetical protein